MAKRKVKPQSKKKPVASKSRSSVKTVQNKMTVKNKKSALEDVMLADIWPMEREVLFRPDRYKYVRKLVKPQGCVFCRASAEAASFETLCLYKSEHSMVVVNKYPYNSGHVLVIPLRHCGSMLELSNEEYLDLHQTLRMALMAVQQTYNPSAFNIGMNHGEVGGAGIPDHLHYHVVPRWAGDVNFFPMIAETKVVIESLEQTYDRLLSFFAGSKKARK